MTLPFLDRRDELSRMRSFFARTEGSLAVLYGRRRCGKSRLLQEALPVRGCVYYVADEREAPLQRTALARQVAGVLPGFDRVDYPDWDALFARWWEDAGPSRALILDEFPAVVASAPEIPSVLQKYVDRKRRPHLVLCGSSQRMMHGLALDRAAPLFGRAREILKIRPLPAGWIREALALRSATEAVEGYAVWGGVPRYWELAAEHSNRAEAVRRLVLDPLGVLHDEPAALLLDDLREIAQTATLLAIVGQGVHRLSEIASRAGKPATSLGRPLQRLLDLGILRRDIPFGSPPRDNKRSLYRIADPFLRFWFRYVDNNRSRLQSGEAEGVAREIEGSLPDHVASVWEDLARESVPRMTAFGGSWTRTSSWWGTGIDGSPLQIDVVAEREGGRDLLVGEATWTEKTSVHRLVQDLGRKAANLPVVAGRKVHLALWLKRSPRRNPERVTVLSSREVLNLSQK